MSATGAPATARDRSAVNSFQVERPGVEYTRAENRDAFATYPAQPPFAFNAMLLDAARAHSAATIAADEQTQRAPGEPDLLQRGAHPSCVRSIPDASCTAW